MTEIFQIEEIRIDSGIGHILKITINRPEARNAVNLEFINQLTQILKDNIDNESLRVLLLTGNGTVFCAGADLKQLATFSVEEKFNYSSNAQKMVNLLATYPVPVIIGLNGHAFGGGFEIALAGDVRISVIDTKFGLTEVRLGLVPAWSGTKRLTEIVGIAKAKDLIFRGTHITTQEAFEMGLIARIFDKKNFDKELINYCNEIASNAPLAVRAAKELMTIGHKYTAEELNAIEIRLADKMAHSKDYKEGITAFNEKRKPKYIGK
jgi:methylglutaconyl-CoA hydratase